MGFYFIQYDIIKLSFYIRVLVIVEIEIFNW